VSQPSPQLWVDAITALLVVMGALAALIGSFGLLRLKTFFSRVHPPTLGVTLGTWSLTLATAVQMSFGRGQIFVHALLIALFLGFTAPITAVFLMRAALFRGRQRGDRGIPMVGGDDPPRA
jgi:multicomponent K+:H+ antiporter subunit G